MLSRDTIRDRNRWIARIAALLALVAVASVFIAPDVDLLDSTCDQSTVITILLLVPAVAAATSQEFPATQTEATLNVLNVQSSAAAPEVLAQTCAWIC